MAGHPLSARTRADHLSACALRHAREHLERLGYELLDPQADPPGPPRLLSCWSGSRRELLFCELAEEHGLGQASATPSPRRRLRRAALAWLAEHPEVDVRALRFDRLTVFTNPHGELVGVEHLPDAF
jgi:hypothetical protein